MKFSTISLSILQKTCYYYIKILKIQKTTYYGKDK